MGRQLGFPPQIQHPLRPSLGIHQGLQQHRGQGLDRGIAGQGFQLQLHPQVALDAGRQLHRHQRIQADVEEGVAGIQAAGVLQAHHGGQALLQQLHHQGEALVVIGLGELLAQGRPLGPRGGGGGRLEQRLQHGRLATAELGRQLGPVVVEHGHASRSTPLQQQGQGIQGLGGGQQAHPQSRESALQPFCHPGTAPGAPLQREQGPGPGGRGCRQAIEGPIGHGVAGLARRAEQGGHRGEGHAKLRPAISQLAGLLQPLPAAPFGGNHRGLAGGGLSLQQAVIEQARRMEHPHQGLAPQGRSQRLRRIGRQIEGQGFTGDALAAQLLHELGIGPPAQQHQRAGPLRGQPATQLLTNPAKGTRHQVSGPRPDRPSSRPLRLGDHHLAHMPGLGHQPEGLHAALDRKGLQRDRRVVTGLEVGEQLHQQATHQGGVSRGHLQQVKGEVGGIRAALGRRRPAPDLDLAQLHKTAAIGQGGKTRVHPVALEAVEHHIHPAASGGGPHLRAEGEAAGVEHRLHPLLQQGRLLGRTGGGPHPRAAAAGHLQGGLADPTGGRMDQHGLARAQLGKGLEAVDGGEEGRADAGPQGRIQRRGQGHAQGGAAHHMAGQAAHRQGRQQPLAHQGWIDPRADRHHPAHAFAAVGQAGIGIHAELPAVGRQEPQGIQDIAEIEARGLHRQFQLARPRAAALQGKGPQGFQAAEGTALQAEGAVGQGLEPLHPGPTIPPGQQGLPIAEGEQGRPVRRGRRDAIGEMQHRPAQGGLLQGSRAGKGRHPSRQGTTPLQHQPHRPGRSPGQLLGPVE